MPPTFPWPVPRKALEDWGLKVGSKIHRAEAVGRRVAVDGTLVPAAWATVDNGRVTVHAGPCGNERLSQLKLPKADIARGLVGAVIAAHLGGHPNARMPKSRPNRIWTHFIAIGLGLDPVKLSRGCPSEPPQVSRRVLDLARTAKVVPLHDQVGEPPTPPGEPEPEPEPEPFAPVARRIPVERHKVDSTSYLSVEQQIQLERREAPLVEDFAAHLRSKGREVDALALELPSWGRVYRADLVDYTKRAVVEAKFEPTIDAVRMAIGQLAHYVFLADRATEPVTLKQEVVLVGREPDDEIKLLLESLNVTLVWRAGDAFVDQPRGAII